MNTIHNEVEALGFGQAERRELASVFGFRCAHAIERAGVALASIEALLELLLAHELEQSTDEPRLVLSQSQRFGLLQAMHVLAEMSATLLQDATDAELRRGEPIGRHA